MIFMMQGLKYLLVRAGYQLEKKLKDLDYIFEIDFKRQQFVSGRQTNGQGIIYKSIFVYL